MASKRHAKPSAQQLASRIYRQQLAGQRAILKQLVSISLDTAAALVSLMELNKLRVKQDEQTARLISLMQRFVERDRYPLTATADHLERLRRQRVASAWKDANEFMDRPLKIPTLRNP